MRAQLISSDQPRIIVGLGKTGLSCARWLYRAGLPFRVVDTRANPPGMAELLEDCPGVELICSPLDAELLCQAQELIVSPGLSLQHSAIAAAIAKGVRVVGDIELFCQTVTAPIVAITGSNGKSTVTTLVGMMAQQAGIDVGVGGNIGVPVLDMLAEGEQALYVLELSSFQLETTYSLRAASATILNVSPDHMDRYDNSIAAYHQAKQRIYRGCYGAVCNRDDALTAPLLPAATRLVSFGTGQPVNLQDFGLLEANGEQWLAQGLTKLMPVSDLKVRGLHNYSNALAALALGAMVDIPMAAMLATLREFTGLPHRCEWVAEKAGVTWINDSKATNTGATIAAIEGLGAELSHNGSTRKIVLIAGGDGKGADFDDLRAPVAQYVRCVIVMGVDGPRLAETLGDTVAVHRVVSLDDAVAQAAALAETGDIVLLAPACASLDMFVSFEQRGQLFCESVEALNG